MILADALAVLSRNFGTASNVVAAMTRAVATRSSSPLSDPLGYSDLLAWPQKLLLGPSEVTLDVEAITKPKQDGGVRVERLADVFTGTFLQLVADALCERRRDSGSATGPFGPVASDGAASYEAWVTLLSSWLRRQINRGHVVLAVDFHAFFPGIGEWQTHSAITEAGLGTEAADATLAVLANINASAAEASGPAIGLPIMPDPIVWILADAVLGAFDCSVRSERSVLNYARWVDDCFLTCDRADVAVVLNRIESLAREHGFRLNASKTRVLTSADDLDRMTLQREHNLLGDLFLLGKHDRGSSIDFRALLPRIAVNLEAGQVASSRVIKRIYALATMLGSTELVDRAEVDLQAFPTAERAILAYIAASNWPPSSHSLIQGALQHQGYDSRQLWALRLALQTDRAHLPTVVREQCRGIVVGEVPAHPVARSLALAVACNGTASDKPLVQRFATVLRDEGSAMARRVGLQALLASGAEYAIDWGRYANDPSGLVRCLVAAVSTASGRRMLGTNLAQPSPRRDGWGSFGDRLCQVLKKEYSHGEEIKPGTGQRASAAG